MSLEQVTAKAVATIGGKVTYRTAAEYLSVTIQVARIRLKRAEAAGLIVRLSPGVYRGIKRRDYDTVAALRRGIADAAAGRLVDLGSFEQYAAGFRKGLNPRHIDGEFWDAIEGTWKVDASRADQWKARAEFHERAMRKAVELLEETPRIYGQRLRKVDEALAVLNAALGGKDMDATPRSSRR